MPVVVIVAALTALGAGPYEPWKTVQTSLPPVAVAPGFPPLPNRAAAPIIVPSTVESLPAHSYVMVLPTSSPAPGYSATVPVRSGLAPVRRPASSIPAVPGKIGSPAAIGMTAAASSVPLMTGANTRVYVINGVDPFGWAGLSEMTDRLRASGYPDTTFGSWYEVLRFDREIRAAYRQDPSAQFIIIGYSFGVYRAQGLASRLAHDGIPIAMVGYIGGDYLRNSPANTRGVGGRVVNVMGDGYLLTGRNWFFNGTDLAGTDNVRMPGVRHFGLPKQEQTVDALVNGMNAATGRVWISPAGITDGTITARPSTMPTPHIISTASPISTGQR